MKPSTVVRATTVAVAIGAASSAHAFLGAIGDAVGSVVKTKTETGQTLVVYDLPGFAGATKDLLEDVRTALNYHGDNAVSHEDTLTTQSPEVPARMTFKAMQLPMGPAVNLPSCPGAAFTISSSDMSLARAGDSSFYMACGFRYTGGMRVNFYAQFTSTSGGVGGLLSGKTIAKTVTKAVGLDTDPQAFINASLGKLEERLQGRGWTFAIVEMSPAIAGKTLAEDPLKKRELAKADEEKQQAQRSKRMAARAELRNLGFDATSAEQFRKAIAAGDEDVVALFLQAGVVDPQQPDESGRPLASYATRTGVKKLLGVL